MFDLEHPDITSALKTGYAVNNQPKSHYCEECGELLDEDVYSDRLHEFLCKDCLLTLHERRNWW